MVKVGKCRTMRWVLSTSSRVDLLVEVKGLCVGTVPLGRQVCVRTGILLVLGSFPECEEV